MKTMFSRFKNFSTTLCDPIRKRYPEALNAVNQAFLARWTGFWMVVKGEK
jgi:hypothetical protein